MMDKSNLFAKQKDFIGVIMPENPEISNVIKPKYVQGVPGHVLDAKYFYYETAPTYNKELAIVCGGYEKCAPDFRLDRNNYPYHVVKYTLKGKGILQIHGESHKLGTGTLSSFSPGFPHIYKADPYNPMEHIFVTFLGNEAPNLLTKSTLASKGARQVSNPDQVANYLHTILNLGMEKVEYSQEIICNYLRILLLEQASSIPSSDKAWTTSIQTYRKCRRYIDNNFSNLYSVQQIADACNVNIRYMSRLFKRYNYITPQKYLMRLKMNKAASLLLNTNLTVAQISHSLGFEDPYHFSRVFKKNHEISPRNYRQSHI
jgi:AraC-like DNA-binding protein